MNEEVLEEFNPWWFSGRVPRELALPTKRRLFHELQGRLRERQAIAVTGLRRVGKSTLLYQLADSLLEKGFPRDAVLYFSFDEKAGSLGEVLDAYRELKGIDFRRERVLLLLDEVQKLDDWARQAKKYYDLYPKLKMLLSGSETIFLRQEYKDALAGRLYEFTLPPLSFTESIELMGLSPRGLPRAKAKALFAQFIRKGGFPEMLGERDEGKIREYVRSAVVEKVVYRDIPGLAKIREPELLKTLLETVAVNPGMYVNYQALSQQLGKDRRVIQDYFQWLEKAFLVRLLANYRGSRLAQVVKMKRAYVTDAAIITAFKHSADGAFLGRMAESAVVNALGAKAFWKNSREVDAVVGSMPVEVKYQAKTTAEDLAGLREFMRRFRQKKALLVTRDEERVERTPEGEIELKPAWKLLLELP